MEAIISVTNEKLLECIQEKLESNNAEDIATISLKSKSDLADVIIIATVKNKRQAGAATAHLINLLHDIGFQNVSAEGFPDCDWILIDADNIIIHLFSPESREYYGLERIWEPIFSDDIQIIH